MALRDILAEFEIKVDDKALKNLEGGLDGTVDKLHSVAAAFTGGLLVNEVGEFINHQIELGSQINDTAEKLGVGTEELQQFQYAAKLSGVEAESAAQSLGFLNKNIGGALGGNKELVKTFADLKVPLKDAGGNVRELGDVLPDIADSFGSLKSQQEKTTVAMSIFGRSGAALLPILSQGSDGLEELYKEFDRLGGSLSEDFIAGADAAGDEIDKLKFSFEGLKSRIAVAVFPTLITLTKYLEGVSGSLVRLSKETNVVQVGLLALAGGAGIGGLRILASLSKSLGFTAQAAEGAGGAIKGIFNLGLKGGAIVAVLTGLAFLAEDLYTLFTGGKSAIGEWLDATQGIGTSKKLVEDLTASYNSLKLSLEDLFGTKIDANFWKELMSTALDDISKRVQSTAKEIEAITDAFGWLSDAWGSFQIKKSDGMPFEKSSTDIWNEKRARRAALKLPAFTDKETIGGIEAGTNLPATVPLPPNLRPKGASATGGAGASISNTVQVTVQGGNSPQETGRNVSQGVKDALSGANNDALNAMLQLGGT